MIKTIVRILILLLISVALGWGTSLLIQRLPQASAARQFNGERPTIGNGAPQGNPLQGFRGDREREEGGGSIIPSLIGIFKNIILFAVGTLIIVALSKLIPKKTAQAEAP
jgi:hypothetical protein